eukprot:TRINITY_DN220_c0_g1_i1.p2 TRINITY_DN220_c0_g1~~TRINITY_DN220_c0_g1_i1.p2  ORF type:complete len:256 (+),score=75.96 TRINITY_DN220_c0_g1_i1:137-904(+)
MCIRDRIPIPMAFRFLTTALLVLAVAFASEVETLDGSALNLDGLTFSGIGSPGAGFNLIVELGEGTAETTHMVDFVVGTVESSNAPQSPPADVLMARATPRGCVVDANSLLQLESDATKQAALKALLGPIMTEVCSATKQGDTQCCKDKNCPMSACWSGVQGGSKPVTAMKKKEVSLTVGGVLYKYTVGGSIAADAAKRGTFCINPGKDQKCASQSKCTDQALSLSDHKDNTNKKNAAVMAQAVEMINNAFCGGV